MIQEAKKPSISDFIGFPYKQQKSKLLDGLMLTGSGKGAIAVIFKYLISQGMIKNKLDEVLVPDWLGYWVYNQIQAYAFPAKKLSERTRAIFVYHQYGYPQDMDKILKFAREHNLIVIEDCAHAIKSFYKGKRLGFIGDFSIFSFSKWFFCYALGGVRGKGEEFEGFVKQKIGATKFGLTFLKDGAKFFYELFSSKTTGSYSNLLLRMSYAIYQDALRPGFLARQLMRQKLDPEIALREKRYQRFLDKTADLGFCDHLPREGVAPYAIPVIAGKEKMENIAAELKNMGIGTGIYQFDANRNMLDPKFEPSVLVPLHSGISDGQFEDIIEKTVKSHG